MKKVPAIILLVLGNLAAVFAVSVLLMLVGGGTYSFGCFGLTVIAGFVFSAALGFASSLIYDKFKKEYGLKPSRFILAAYVPSAAGSIISVIVILILDNLHYFKGFLGGVGEFISSLFIAAVAVLYLIFGSCITLSTTKENDDTKG